MMMKLRMLYRVYGFFLLVGGVVLFLGEYPANIWAAGSPSAGETVDEPPTEIAVDFAEPLDIVFLRLQVLDADGRDHAIGPPVIRADRKRLSVKVDALKPGAFTVEWGVVDSQGHLSKGAFSFSVSGVRTLTRTWISKHPGYGPNLGPEGFT